jgi:hypothetical protein
MNLMLINVSTRKFRRAVRLPEGDVPAPAGAGVSKSAASRHFVALSAARMKDAHEGMDGRGPVRFSRPRPQGLLSHIRRLFREPIHDNGVGRWLRASSA